VLAVLGAGEGLGEMSAADSLGRSASVVTLEKTTLLWMDRRTFGASVASSTVLSGNLAEVLSKRARLANARLIFEVALGSKAEEVRKFRVPLGHGIAGLVAVSGQPMAISDAAKDQRQAADIAESVGYQPESILRVPLFYEEELIGVLELLDREGAPAYSTADMATLGLFANQAAVAIEQSRNQQNMGELLGDVIQSLGGVPDHREEGLLEGSRTFTAGVEEDASYRRALELAALVREISHQGEEEHRACRTILEVFAGYLRSRPRADGEAGEGW
jgi:GAF domain-containing protein